MPPQFGLQPGMVPMPAGPPPNNFVEGIFAVQQYQQVPAPVSPMPGQPYYMPPPPPGTVPQHTPDGVHEAGEGFQQGSTFDQLWQRAGDPEAYLHSQGHGHPPIPDTRIVYGPYASPPPIYVERIGKAISRPKVLRSVLGDANIYEYPEMPQQLYTTRGPRDFMAPNPPSIGY
jgi:hypothetical protein